MADYQLKIVLKGESHPIIVGWPTTLDDESLERTQDFIRKSLTEGKVWSLESCGISGVSIEPSELFIPASNILLVSLKKVG